ncbi:MAG: heavy metal translocating P-type ATPase, partial [Fusobacteriaceae bacterium]|nr:heavy metal translocating P-type ATPase [Fusobacteriaceae bacterium]
MILKKEYIIKNLHCTNCASKIEANIKKMNIVSDANIDFYTGKLTLTLKEETDDEPFIKKLSFICDKIEPGTFVKTIDYIEEDSSPLEELLNIDEEIIKDEDSEENRKEHIKELIINSGLIVSIFIFLISFFIDSNFNKNLLLVIAYFLSATDILIISLKNIKRGNFLDENFLMSIATIGAFALGDFSEAVAVMIFYKIGEFFQEKAVANSKKSIEKLLSLKANYANLKTSSGELKKVSPETVKIGEIITIKTGEKIPLDGTVVLGESLIDNSALTGESIPVSVKVGTTILSGGILLGSSIDVEVISVYSDSTVSKIIELVKNANSRKPESEKFITKFARFYTPTVVALSVIIAIFPPFILDQPFTIWFGRALIFLVISCPCALVLSI